MSFTDQMRPQLRKFALPKMGKALEEFFARHQRKHRISEKFQLLVVADLVLALARLLRFLLPRLRTMRDRLFKDGPPPEMVAQPLFQRRDFPFLHAGARIYGALKSRDYVEQLPSATAVRRSPLPAVATPSLLSQSSFSVPPPLPEASHWSAWSAGPSHRALPSPHRRPADPW